MSNNIQLHKNDLPDDLEELDPFLDETAKITFDLVSLGKVVKK